MGRKNHRESRCTRWPRCTVSQSAQRGHVDARYAARRRWHRTENRPGRFAMNGNQRLRRLAAVIAGYVTAGKLGARNGKRETPRRSRRFRTDGGRAIWQFEIKSSMHCWKFSLLKLGRRIFDEREITDTPLYKNRNRPLLGNWEPFSP